jgi:hypothetical protein
LVTPKFYDDGTDLVALANNKWASHTLLRSPKEDDLFILVVSPAVYASEAEAQAAGIYYGLFQNQALSGLYPVCHLLVKGASTNVIVHDHRPVIGQSAGGILGTASLQQIYDNSVTPEILTDTTRGALSVKRGTAADTDNVFEGLNGAGSTTFSVDGNGEIDGKDVTPSDTLNTTATTMVTAINEIHGEIDAHIADTVDAHDASAISNVPAGGIAATTVQAAINELDTEKAPLASPSFTGTAEHANMPTVGGDAIVEQGSNSNGTYIKYANGTLICRGSTASTVTTSTATGGVYYGNSTITFPYTFNDALLTISPGAKYTAGIAWAGRYYSVTTTGAAVTMMGSTSTSAAYYTYVAVGEWK